MIKNKLISHNKVEIESILSDWFYSNVNSEDEIFIKRFKDQNCKITIFITEDYYFRIESTLTLTVIVEETIDKTTVEVVSSGGKAGLWGFSYGAEKSAVKRIVRLLKENGFTEQ